MLEFNRLARIKTNDDATEALRQLREMQEQEQLVSVQYAENEKKVMASVKDRLDKLAAQREERLQVSAGGKATDIPTYRAALTAELERWAKEDFADSTLKTEFGTVAVRKVPQRLDAPGTDTKERERNRKDVVETWWSKFKGKAFDWLQSLNLDPWFRVKFELNTEAINNAFKSGMVTLADAKRFGLELVPESSTVSVKLT